jgi:hypothetical protein
MGKFERMFKADPIFGAKVGYRIDTIFQTFCLELSKFADKRYPIEEARRDLKGYMEDKIVDLVKEVRRGTVPSMILLSIRLAHAGTSVLVRQPECLHTK